ncbi:MAG TPA: hypothetical protein H9934_06395 [Candidatus Anaerobutyricum faecale]|nr:hypothetical protein [Candidatus Anaerobutyricum faecale]
MAPYRPMILSVQPIIYYFINMQKILVKMEQKILNRQMTFWAHTAFDREL